MGKTYLDNKEIIDKFRPNACFEIQKIIDCYNKNLGCSLYECPSCHDIVFIGHTCKSRFCSSCGYKYKNDRVENILQTAYNCQHRQIVFTTPEQLRKYLFFPFENRINLLFKAVRNTIYSILNKSFKKDKKGIFKKYTSKIRYSPGFFALLHTFGRDLKWNPHIHILIAEIKLGNNGSCLPWKFFDYDALSFRFQKLLLDLLSKELGNSFDKDKNFLYRKYSKGFYVYAEPKEFKDLKSGIEYLTRYCGRLPISENRIVNYDGTNVTFSYIDHKDNEFHEVTLLVSQFIMVLLRHLLPTQFKIIRYYGFIMFDFNSFPFALSGKTVAYICPKCKYKFDAPIETVLEFEQEDVWNGLPISTPPYTICAKCNFDKCVPIDYVSNRGFHHIYKDN